VVARAKAGIRATRGARMGSRGSIGMAAPQLNVPFSAAFTRRGTPARIGNAVRVNFEESDNGARTTTIPAMPAGTAIDDA